MFDLTIPQQNILNLQQYFEGSSIGNVCGAFFFKHLCCHEELNQVLNMIIESQSALRLRFDKTSDGIMQYIENYSEQSFLSMTFTSQAEYKRYVHGFARNPFPLLNQCMYRFVIVDVEKETGVLLCASHLIVDAWSVSLISNQIARYYNALHTHQVIEPLAGDFEQIVASERAYLSSKKYSADEEYWRKAYENGVEVSHIKPNSLSKRKPKAERFSYSLSLELSSAIDAFSKDFQVSQAVLFETAIVCYLNQINHDSSYISIGTLVLNRANQNERNCIGMCVATLPLKIPVDESMSSIDLCKSITKQHFGLFRHQRFPHSEIMRILREQQETVETPYEILFSFQNAQTKAGDEGRTEWISNGYCEVPMEFHVDNRDGTDHYTCTIDYQTCIFDLPEIKCISERINYILQQIIQAPNIILSDISILPDKEKHIIIEEFNQTNEWYDKTKCVHEVIGSYAKKAPDKPAILFEDRVFTYGQLDKMSDALALHLRKQGIERNDIVPIISKRSWHLFVGMLGIMKAGGAYMNVDPTYPHERIDTMLKMAECKLVLSYGCLMNTNIPTIMLDSFDYATSEIIDNINKPEDLCYVIFTSGSTGTPKGLKIAHYNVDNFAANSKRNFIGGFIGENDSMLAVTNLIFDMAVTETLLPLMNGLTVYLANEEQSLSQIGISTLISAGGIDFISTTPTKMRIFMMDKTNLSYLKKLKGIILGGEALPEDLFAEIKKVTSAKVINAYGPAETTVYSTFAEVTSKHITVGMPIINTQIYIVGKNNKPLPIGISGELCISGDGVGSGYLGRPDLTAERFVYNPFATKSNGHGNIMYRTGDLARWQSNGEIEYIGRIDNQVKIHGQRIELSEIESTIAAFAGIQLTAVAEKRDKNDRQYIVGYYTADTEIDEKSLRQYLFSKLPKYMIPHYFVRLEKMPLTTGGKTDRKNLPSPQFTMQRKEYVKPETDKQRVLCELISDLFGIPSVGITDDFFELGGDSLGVIMLVAHANSSGIEFSIQNVFEHPTVKSLCEFLDTKNRESIKYDAMHFEKYKPLLDNNRIDESFVPAKKSLGNVLITGCTGFLGAHIIDALMQAEHGKAYCLIRETEESSLLRLQRTLKYYFNDKYNTEIGIRIIPIVGDVERLNIESLPHDIQTVIHVAASVKHYGSYEYFNRVNVIGTKNVIQYASSIGAKMIHISTISVSGNSLVDAFDLSQASEPLNFSEDVFYIGQPLDNVYVRSKFEAERLVLDAALAGNDTKIIRVGNLTNRRTDYRFQPNYKDNAFLKRVKAVFELGLFPDYLLPLYAEFSPVDQTAEGIIKIAQYAEHQCVFHLNSDRPLYFDQLLEMLNHLGIKMNVVNKILFNDALKKSFAQASTAYIYEALQHDMDSDGKLVYYSNIKIQNEFTHWFMGLLGFEWIEVDFEYIQGYVEYFRKLGYFQV